MRTELKMVLSFSTKCHAPALRHGNGKTTTTTTQNIYHLYLQGITRKYAVCPSVLSDQH